MSHPSPTDTHTMLAPILSQPLTERLAHFKEHHLGIIIDDSREAPRAALTGPAHLITEPDVARCLNISGGLLCVAVSEDTAEACMLSPMSRPFMNTRNANLTTEGYSFCTSVEAREGVTTGISASDRAHTIQCLGASPPHPRTLVSPGHIFPILAKNGGVLIRGALPEGALDLTRLVWQRTAALFIELLTKKGELPLYEDILKTATVENLPAFTLSELIQHRLTVEPLVHRVAEAKLPTQVAGEFRSIIYRSLLHGGEHLALIKGELLPDAPILTRVHLESPFTDIFGSETSGSRAQIHSALRALDKAGSGVFIYLRKPSSSSQEAERHSWVTTSPPPHAAMMREFGLGAQIVRDLGIKKLALLTSNKKSYVGLDTFGIEIVSQQPIPE
jgi:3,4-dihydroxy 2-butanone 4-phosphate synthase/GTP cyclohydrolase II